MSLALCLLGGGCSIFPSTPATVSAAIDLPSWGTARLGVVPTVWACLVSKGDGQLSPPLRICTQEAGARWCFTASPPRAWLLRSQLTSSFCPPPWRWAVGCCEGTWGHHHGPRRPHHPGPDQRHRPDANMHAKLTAHQLLQLSIEYYRGPFRHSSWAWCKQTRGQGPSVTVSSLGREGTRGAGAPWQREGSRLKCLHLHILNLCRAGPLGLRTRSICLWLAGSLEIFCRLG